MDKCRKATRGADYGSTEVIDGVSTFCQNTPVKQMHALFAFFFKGVCVFIFGLINLHLICSPIFFFFQEMEGTTCNERLGFLIINRIKLFQ